MHLFKPAIFALFLSLFSTAAAPRALAQAPRLAQAAAGERIGVGDLDLRWNMSVAQARAATPQKHAFTSGGHLPTRDIYRVSQVVVPNVLAKHPHLFTATLYFEKDRLVSFDMIPERDGEEEGYIGHVGAMSQSVDLTVHHNRAFGASVEKAKYDVTDKARVLANGVETMADLGFQIQFRVWRARGAFYRESLLRGDKAGKMTVLRFQGRLAAPFQTPTDKIHNGMDRQSIARDLSANFALPAWVQQQILADKWAFMSPKPARQGKGIGVARFNWGMTGPEILAARLDGVATVRALPGKGNSFQVDKLQLRPGSPNGWTLQLWVDKKGLSAFELRPMKEGTSDKIVGYPDEAIAAEF